MTPTPNDQPDRKWYLAELLETFHVADEETYSLYINCILVHASDAEEAYTKALKFGDDYNYEYLNTDGVLVTVRFGGLRNLLEIYEDLEDGSEIFYESYEELSKEDIERKARKKEELAVFQSPKWKELLNEEQD